MKVIYMNCGVKNYMKVDYRRYHRSYRRNFLAAWNFSGFLFATAKVASITVMIHFHIKLSRKQTWVKKKKKKKWEIVGLSSSRNLHSVTISRVIISVSKGRRKLGRLRNFSVPLSPLYFLSFPCLNGLGRTVMCSLCIYTASQYLMEILP